MVKAFEYKEIDAINAIPQRWYLLKDADKEFRHKSLFCATPCRFVYLHYTGDFKILLVGEKAKVIPVEPGCTFHTTVELINTKIRSGEDIRRWLSKHGTWVCSVVEPGNFYQVEAILSFGEKVKIDGKYVSFDTFLENYVSLEGKRIGHDL